MTTPNVPGPVLSDTELSDLVHPHEKVYFGIMALISIAIYGVLLILLVANQAARPTIILYAVIFALFSLIAHGYMLGHIRANAVRVSARQFPLVHSLISEHSRRLGMKAPEAFVLQSGGALNAFATRFLGRTFVVLYSDVLAAAANGGESAVSFVIGHELGHHKLGHLVYRWLLAPARCIPFLGSAYSRACEYSCDRVGAALAPDGAVRGLLVLAAGRSLFHEVDPRAYAAQTTTEAGFWFSFTEIFASHPHLTRRVAALLGTAGVRVPDSPMRLAAAAQAVS